MIRRRWVVFFCLVFIAILLLGNQGFRRTVRALRERARLARSLLALHAEHDRLMRELNLIQHDPSYVDYLVRKNLGYVGKGEIEYRLIPTEKTKDSK